MHLPIISVPSTYELYDTVLFKHLFYVLLPLHLGCDPVQVPSAEHVLVLSPSNSNPVLQLYVATD